MIFEVAFSPQAQAELDELYLYIAAQGAPDTALRYLERIEAFCQSLQQFPDRGLMRDDIRPGLRMISFERRLWIAYDVADGRVVILRVLHSSRDLASALKPTPSSAAP